MHDIRTGRDDTWRDAFAALPLAAPPADSWTQVLARLGPPAPARRHAPVRRAFAIAAVLAMVCAVPLWWMRDTTPDAAAGAPGVALSAVAPADPLDALQSESAELERVLRATRDDSVATATAAVLAAELDDRLARIDAALMHPRDDRDARALWQTRVAVLRDAVDLAGARRWLAVHGARYDASVVQID